jgi:hypothetical protein
LEQLRWHRCWNEKLGGCIHWSPIPQKFPSGESSPSLTLPRWGRELRA